MPAPLNDHDLIVRIDARMEALHEGFTEMKTGKADAAQVKRLEERVKTGEQKQDASDRKLNYILGGLVVFEAALKFVGR